MPAQLGGMIKGAQTNLAAVKDRVTMVKGGAEFLPGITAVDTPGHTPGHLSFLIAGGEGLLLTGDATTQQIISFEHPEWKFAYDAVHEQAVQTRKTLLDRLATDKTKLLGYHFIYPGVGMAEKNGTAYRFGGELTACHRSPGEARHRPRLLAFGLSSRQPYSRQEARAGFAS